MTSQLRFWITGHNMPGYLPDNDPYVFTTTSRRAAIGRVRSEARDDCSSLNDGLWALESEARRDCYYTMSGRDGSYWLSARTGASYHYWLSEASGELVEIPEAPAPGDYSRGAVRCDGCERDISGELGWSINAGDAYLCEDCAS